LKFEITFCLKSLFLSICIVAVNINFTLQSLGIQYVNTHNHCPFFLTVQPTWARTPPLFVVFKSVYTCQRSWIIPLPLTSGHMQSYVQNEGWTCDFQYLNYLKSLVMYLCHFRVIILKTVTETYKILKTAFIDETIIHLKQLQWLALSKWIFGLIQNCAGSQHSTFTYFRTVQDSKMLLRKGVP
jgi:hypothetical protein